MEFFIHFLIFLVGLALIALLVNIGGRLEEIRESLRRLVERTPSDFIIQPQQFPDKDVVNASTRKYAALFKIMKDDLGDGQKYAPDIFFNSKADATEVLDALKAVLNKYGFVMLIDLYDLVGIVGNFEDSKWGWDDLASAVVIPMNDEKINKIVWQMALPLMKNMELTNSRITLKEVIDRAAEEKAAIAKTTDKEDT